MRTLILLLTFISIPTWARPITGNQNLSCTPQKKCSIQPTNQKIKPIFVSFSERKQAGKKSIFSVHFNYPRGGSQVDSIKRMENVNLNDPYEFKYVDLDGDRHKDLAIKVGTGTNINHFHYWHYSPSKGRYIPLGIHEEVYFDEDLKKLQSVRRHQSEHTRNFEVSGDEIKPVDR